MYLAEGMGPNWEWIGTGGPSTIPFTESSANPVS